MIFAHQNLISDQLTYYVHSKSTGELISFGFSDRSIRSLLSAISLSEIALVSFGLSPNLGLSETLSERLIQKVK